MDARGPSERVETRITYLRSGAVVSRVESQQGSGCTFSCTRRSAARPLRAEPTATGVRRSRSPELAGGMALEKDFPPRRPSPTRSVGLGRSSAGSSQASVCEDTLLTGGVAAAGARSPSRQQQRSPNHSVRRKPRSSPHRYHGSHSNGCASATASPQKDASNCVSRSQSMRTSRRPQSLHYHFRQRIASIPGDMLAVHQDALGGGSNDSRGSSNNSLPTDEAGDVLRLRNFAVTSKGIVNRGDSFRSKSRSTHSVSSTGSGHKLAVPSSSVSASPSETGDASSDVVSEKFYMCASLDGDGRVVSSQLCQSPPWVAEAGLTRTDRTSLRVDCQEPTASLPPELVVTRTGDSPPARYRVLVLGASQVGKTSLTSQFMTSEYICSYDSSVDEDNEKAVMVVLNGEESELVFIEHAHQDELLQTRTPLPGLKSPPQAFNPVSAYSPDAYLVVYNVCNRGSLKTAKDYLSLIRRLDSVDHKAVILVGNKTDLVRLRTVATDDGRYLATSEGVKFIETSAGINHHVDELLAGLLHQIRLKGHNSEKEGRKRDSIRIRGRNSSCASSFSGCKAKVFLKRFLRKACSRSRSCDDLHVL